METPAVVIDRITKHFPVQRGWSALVREPFRRETVTALRSTSLQVARGSCHGILGPNGAGKTTIFRILATLVEPDAGEAFVMDHDIRREGAAVRAALGHVVPNERSLYWRLSALENLRLFARLYGITGSRASHRIEEVLAVVDLDITDGRHVAVYSSGMRQRLLIARALLSQPRVLLLDEPTRSLDPVSAKKFRAFLRHDVIGREGCTVLLATHDTEDVHELCDRVAILNVGEVLVDGTTDSLMERFGDHRYRLSTNGIDRRTVASAASQVKGAVVADVFETDDGWYRVDIDIPGGKTNAASVLAAVVGAGVPVARFEKVRLSLADLLERVLAAQESSGG